MGEQKTSKDSGWDSFSICSLTSIVAVDEFHTQWTQTAVVPGYAGLWRVKLDTNKRGGISYIEQGILKEEVREAGDLRLEG